MNRSRERRSAGARRTATEALTRTVRQSLGSFSGARKKQVLALVLVLGAIGLALYFFAGARPLAVLLEFSERPERDVAARMNFWRPAEVGDRFFEGDAARTSAASSAEFRLGARARLSLRPASQVRFGRREGTGALGVTVELGQVDVGTEDEGFRLSSMFGELAIGPGSVVALRREGKRLHVGVTLGRVELLGDAPETLVAGQTLVLELGGAIIEPEMLKAKAPAPPPTPPALDQGDSVDGGDLTVTIGDSFWVHDPAPPARIAFRFGSRCSGPARFVSGTSVVEAMDQVNLKFDAGRHRYELRCLSDPDRVAAEGQFDVLRDKGSRPLPTYTPAATVQADGRLYTIFYQERLPQITVTWPSAPAAPQYSLLVDGQSRTLEVASATLAAGQLGPGDHEVSFTAPTTPPRASRKTRIQIKYDAQAPTARVAEPSDGFELGAPVTISGQAMPGFSVSVAGKPVELDALRRFSVEANPSGTLVLAFSRPGRGTHYYLRRPKGLPP